MNNVKNNFINLILKRKNLIIDCLVTKNIFFSQTEKQERDKIRIKNNWDQFPTGEKNDESVFVGREKNLTDLKHWINDSKGGALLISGVRGVGKTSFVYKAIYEAKKANGLIKLVEINGSTLSSDSTKIDSDSTKIDSDSTKIDSDSTKNLDLIRNIIESLYYLDQKNIKSLHELAQSTEASNQKTTQTKHGFKFNIFIKTGVKIFISVILFFLFNFIPILSTNFELMGQIIPLRQIILLISSLFLGDLAIEFVYEKKKENNLMLKIETNSYVYLKHLLIENLKNGRSSRLCRFLPSKFRRSEFVFVIDELDKIGDFEKFDKVVRSVKTLITIPNAKFIFICDDKLHSNLKSKIIPGDPYPLSSTYFSWEIFIPPLDSKDITDFIKELSVDSLVKYELSKIDAISLYIYSQTAGIPSKVKSVLRDFINHSENGDAYIDLNILDDNKLKIARLTKLYEETVKTFDSKEYSKQKLNHDRREILYPIFKKIISPGSSFDGQQSIYNIITDTENPAKESFAFQSNEYNLLKNEIIQIFSDINDKANIKNQLNNLPISGDGPVNFSFDISQASPLILDLTKSEPTILEKELKEKLVTLNENLKKIKLRLGIINNSRLLSIIDSQKDYNSSYNTIEAIVDSINNDELIDQSSVESWLEELDDLNNKLKQNFADLVVNYFKPVLKFAYDLSTSTKLVKFISNSKVKRFQLNIQTIKTNDDIIKKINQILVNLRNGSEFNYINNWETKPINTNKPWRFDAYDLEIKSNSEFRALTFQVKTTTDYWRIGLAFGLNSKDIKTLGDDDQYTLFHFHKDRASGELKYQRFRRIHKGIEIHDSFGCEAKNIHPKSNLVVEIKSTSNNIGTYIDLTINNNSIDRFKILKSDLKKASIVVWTDKYKRTEPIVIETIILETKKLTRNKKIQK